MGRSRYPIRLGRGSTLRRAIRGKIRPGGESSDRSVGCGPIRSASRRPKRLPVGQHSALHFGERLL